MRSRLCPTEELLSEYLIGGLSTEERRTIEKHLEKCHSCRGSLVETYEVLKKLEIIKLKKVLMLWIKQNIWLLSSILFLLLSFFIHRYFLQLLVLSMLTGAKWIIDKRTTKMMFIQKEVKKEELWKLRSK